MLALLEGGSDLACTPGRSGEIGSAPRLHAGRARVDQQRVPACNQRTLPSSAPCFVHNQPPVKACNPQSRMRCHSRPSRCKPLPTTPSIPSFPSVLPVPVPISIPHPRPTPAPASHCADYSSADPGLRSERGARATQTHRDNLNDARAAHPGDTRVPFPSASRTPSQISMDPTTACDAIRHAATRQRSKGNRPASPASWVRPTPSRIRTFQTGQSRTRGIQQCPCLC